MKQKPDILILEEVESTNRYLSKASDPDQKKTGFMVCAHHQHSGRGQSGNTWHSAKGQNLLCSVSYEPIMLEPVNQFYIAKIASLACSDMLSKRGIHTKFKWPNDIYLGDRKLGGILIENSVSGNRIDSSVIGVGINVNQVEFPCELPNPVSMKMADNKTYDIHQLAKSLQSSLLYWFRILDQNNIKLIDKAYWNALYRKDGEWLFMSDGKTFIASISDIKPSGQIVLKTERGTKAFWFKEVEFIVE